mmetsp:Transcript_3966/g.11489  ORF Transcript_3966/g.11489 Transcript_3966/m.11489 type:complete len:337 (+) Transcript_3966:770-1780(+)
MQRKTVKNDIPTVRNISLFTGSAAASAPTPSRNARATAYIAKQRRTHDQPRVRTPPMVPFTMTTSSENTCNRRTRRILAILTTLTVLNTPNVVDARSLLHDCVRKTTMSSVIAEQVNTISNQCHHLSGPHPYWRKPSTQTLIRHSTKNMTANTTSMTIQPDQSVETSALTPKRTTLAMMTTAMIESSNITFCAGVLRTTVLTKALCSRSMASACSAEMVVSMMSVILCDARFLTASSWLPDSGRSDDKPAAIEPDRKNVMNEERGRYSGLLHSASLPTTAWHLASCDILLSFDVLVLMRGPLRTSVERCEPSVERECCLDSIIPDNGPVSGMVRPK